MITIGFSSRKVDSNFIELLKKTCGVSNPEIIPIENEGKYSLPEAYNMILEQSTNDIVVLCHDDIYFDSKNWGSKILKHFKRNPEYGILGYCKS
jgi:sugar lactone lactonase YvrE